MIDPTTTEENPVRGRQAALDASNDDQVEHDSRDAVDAVETTLDIKPSKDDYSNLGDTSPFAEIIARDIPVIGRPLAAGIRALEKVGANLSRHFHDKALIPSEVQSRIRVAVAFFESKGWKKEEAVGITANLLRESGLNEKIHGDSGRAYGLAQMHEDRRNALSAHFGMRFEDMNFVQQLGAIHYELTEGREYRAGSALKGASNAYEAAKIVSMKYERPADKFGQAEFRGETAQNMMAIVNGATPAQAHQPPYKKLAAANDAPAPSARRPHGDLHEHGLATGTNGPHPNA